MPAHEGELDVRDLGAALRRARIDLGLSLREAAERALVDRKYLSAVERGESRKPGSRVADPSFRWVWGMAAALGVSLAQLEEDIEDEARRRRRREALDGARDRE